MYIATHLSIKNMSFQKDLLFPYGSPLGNGVLEMLIWPQNLKCPWKWSHTIRMSRRNGSTIIKGAGTVVCGCPETRKVCIYEGFPGITNWWSKNTPHVCWRPRCSLATSKLPNSVAMGEGFALLCRLLSPWGMETSKITNLSVDLLRYFVTTRKKLYIELHTEIFKYMIYTYNNS